jgi:hypothetical protein
MMMLLVMMLLMMMTMKRRSKSPSELKQSCVPWSDYGRTCAGVK